MARKEFPTVVLLSIAVITLGLITLSSRQDTTAAKTQRLVGLPLHLLPEPLKKLVVAYPDCIVGADSNYIYWHDGSRMVFDDGILDKDSLTLLINADLEEQMRQPYQRGTMEAPHPYYNPGRLRHEPFFKKMYGENRLEVERNLTKIRWLPKTLNQQIIVTRVNGVDKKLKEISEVLDDRPHLLQYLRKPGGGYNWRQIRDTNRLSMHSFGIAVDINVQLSDYWEWKNPKDAKVIVYRNRIPMELVEVFEQHGFIWGGKWYYYDTMHFEYRPELID